MTKKRPMVIFGGSLAILIIFAIFVPAILGSTSQNDIEKYNGSSQQGNDTVRIAHAVNTFFVGLTVVPLQWVIMLVALGIVIIAVLMFRRKK